jgi:hypothetical protein
LQIFTVNNVCEPRSGQDQAFMLPAEGDLVWRFDGLMAQGGWLTVRRQRGAAVTLLEASSYVALIVVHMPISGC